MFMSIKPWSFLRITVICESYVHVWKLINGMTLLLLSHQTTKALLVEWEYWADSQKFTPK